MAERLLNTLYQVGGEHITHALDGASYLVVDEDNLQQSVLIDCGSPLGYASLANELDGMKLLANAIENIYATHCHFDHIAAASLMKNARLHINPEDKAAVEQQDTNLTASFLYEKEFPPITQLVALEDEEEILVGKTVVKAIHTPGHTPGSTCFNVILDDGTSVLLAGDTLWGGYEPRIHSNLDRWSDSLDKLSRHAFDFVSFGHGINYLVPDAMAHIALAQSHFMVDIQPSHGGNYYNPWAAPSE